MFFHALLHYIVLMCICRILIKITYLLTYHTYNTSRVNLNKCRHILRYFIQYNEMVQVNFSQATWAYCSAFHPDTEKASALHRMSASFPAEAGPHFIDPRGIEG